MLNAYGFIWNFKPLKQQERGVLLSGGQNREQLLGEPYNPEIMILDEASSALDTESEDQYRDALS